jgi:hypothetical protein
VVRSEAVAVVEVLRRPGSHGLRTPAFVVEAMSTRWIWWALIAALMTVLTYFAVGAYIDSLQDRQELVRDIGRQGLEQHQ